MVQLRLARSFSPAKIALWILMIAVAWVTLMPFAWMISTSFKLDEHVFNYPMEWIPIVFAPENYAEVWSKVPFGLYYFNSLKVAILTTLAQLITSSLAGYAFARLTFVGRDKLFLVYLATIMVPFQVIMIPQYVVMRNLGLINSHWALIIMEAFTPY